MPLSEDGWGDVVANLPQATQAAAFAKNLLDESAEGEDWGI
jgi:hypothetical protein